MAETKWQKIRYMTPNPIGENGEFVTGGKAHIALSRRAARQSAVLIKNDGLLPLKKGTRVALFGKATADYVKGGGGSGDVICAYVKCLADGMDEQQGLGKVEVYQPLSDFYRAYVRDRYALGDQPGMFTEPALPSHLLEGAKDRADVAIISICRYSGQAWDRTGKAHDGDFYLSPEEEKLVQQVTDAFDRVAVVLNIGGMMDTSWLGTGRIGAVLLAGQGGMEGAMAVADILVGDVNPSGRLTDTFARSFDDYPSSETFNESEMYVTYDEDIFVGYRYFETIPGAAQKVVYPFGFGLSYTHFEYANAMMQVLQNQVQVCLTVQNVGNVAGREVVQLYCRQPQGLMGKPRRVLCAFGKTRLLQPGESEAMVLTFTLESLASYDDEGKVCISAWVLEKGEYGIEIGTSAHDTHQIAAFIIKENMIINRVQQRCRPHHMKKRMRFDGTFTPMEEDDTPTQWEYSSDRLRVPGDGETPVEHVWEDSWHPLPSPFFPEPEGKIKLDQVARGQAELDAFINQLSDEQLVHLTCGQPNRGVANTFGFGHLEQWGVPNVMTADGPAGLRVLRQCGVNTTAFPVSSTLCCSWDTDLMYEVGHAGAMEVHECGIGVWLTPAINIHRTPLCGRNFEYYSEDPVLCGKMASAMIRGIQSVGVACSLKHFACNNKQTNRRESDSRLTERALREIYLRAFEICVKEADPWTIMTSYNIINGVRASRNEELLNGILRGEWGYQGVVTTDWWNHAEQWAEINAGGDVKMGCGTPEYTLQMLREGKLKRDALMLSVRRMLTLMLKLA